MARAKGWSGLYGTCFKILSNGLLRKSRVRASSECLDPWTPSLHGILTSTLHPSFLHHSTGSLSQCHFIFFLCRHPFSFSIVHNCFIYYTKKPNCYHYFLTAKRMSLETLHFCKFGPSCSVPFPFQSSGPSNHTPFYPSPFTRTSLLLRSQPFYLTWL